MKWILIFLLVIPFCYADINSSILSGTDSDLLVNLINPTDYNTTYIEGAFLYLPLSVIISSTTGGGGGQLKTSTLYYDVILSLDKTKYTEKDTIHATLIIINKGYVPDRDGILTWYIQDLKTNKSYFEDSHPFELIPPTCVQGRYNSYTDKCELYNGSITESLKWSMQANVSIPTNATLGQWMFNVRYKSYIQPEIEAYKGFEVYTPYFNWWILIIIAGILIYLERRRRQHGY
jgi:hypothetical protein